MRPATFYETWWCHWTKETMGMENMENKYEWRHKGYVSSWWMFFIFSHSFYLFTFIRLFSTSSTSACRLGSGPVVTGAWELPVDTVSIPRPAPRPSGKVSNESLVKGPISKKKLYLSILIYIYI
jgi:hypothetical protein